MTEHQTAVLDEQMVILKDAILSNDSEKIQSVYDTLRDEGLDEHADSVREQFKVIDRVTN